MQDDPAVASQSSAAFDPFGLRHSLQGVQDPERRRKNQLYINQNFGEYNRYGHSLASLMKKREMALMNGASTALFDAKIKNRMEDGVVKKISPSYRVRGRGLYTGGRGLYMGGRGRYHRRRRGVRGRGAYGLHALRRKIARTAGGVAKVARSVTPGAAALAGMYNPSLGSQVSSTGAMIARGAGIVSGRGGYAARGFTPNVHNDPEVVGNSLIEGLGSSIPTFETIRDETGALVVTHTEFVADVYGNDFGVNFANTSFSINPGLARTFPFLSQIAANFEEYEMIQCMFVYKSKLTNNLSSSDGQVGSVLMYTDYNPTDAEKNSKQQMMQSYGVSNGRVVDHVMHGIECDPAKIKGDGHKFVRVQPVTGDLNDYDAGLFQIAIHGTPNQNEDQTGAGALANEILGELHVSYRCVLRKSRVFSLYGLALQRDLHMIEASAGSYDTATLVGYASTNGIGTSISYVARDMTLTFPASFAGPVKIEVRQESGGDLTDYGTGSITTAGNVTLMPWLATGFFGSSGPIHWVSSQRAPESELVIDSHSWMLTITIQVEQAESGTDNTITWQTPIFSQEVETKISVERFNSFGLPEGPTIISSTP